MGRTKGSVNKSSTARPDISTLPVEQRILFLANLIVDTILEKRKNYADIFEELEEQ